MKLVTYIRDSQVRLGALKDGHVVDLPSAAAELSRLLPSTMLDLLAAGEAAMDTARDVVARADLDATYCVPASSVRLLAPVPRPPSMRDGYAFRQHVETARRNRGVEMIPEFDQFPVFYFTNHNAVFGPGRVPVRELHLGKLDFELECAIVIGKGGRDIPASKADEHIAGYTVMNDLSARVLQMEEMKLSLGPAKGKDFATVIGPYLVTPDELAEARIQGSQGDRYDLEMRAVVNGVQVSHDSLKNMNWTFAQLIERASYGVDLYPGDVIGSGTCGTGCFLELNGSKVTNNQWLRPGDRVELSIARLGTLVTEIVLGS